MNLKLSVLDQTPVRKGGNASEALQESIELAQHADKLGYTRYWLSEHHNTITLAGAAPEIFIARLAAETSNIRLGTGGIMLPNHSALKVAEDFRLLEALYPNRIDLGIGRAPGGDRATSRLLNPSNNFDPQDYLQQIRDLQDFFNESPSEGNLQGKIIAIPSIETSPPLWALTSSGESAYIAAHFGIGLSYAQFINPVGGPEALKLYKERFRPSVAFPKPQTNVGIFAFCAEDDQKLKEAKKLIQYRLISFEKGNFNQLFDYSDIKDYQFSPAEEQRLISHSKRYIVASPKEMKKQLTELATTFGTDEIVISTFTDNKEDRLESYRLLAELFLKNQHTQDAVFSSQTLVR